MQAAIFYNFVKYTPGVSEHKHFQIIFFKPNKHKIFEKLGILVREICDVIC